MVGIDNFLRMQTPLQDGQASPGRLVVLIGDQDHLQIIALLRRVIADLTQPIPGLDALLTGGIQP
jgi:hypothetical protein